MAEQGETLCVALGELSAGICPPPPVDSDRPRLIRRGEIVAGALSRDAQRITLQLDRGDDVTVRTTDGPAHTGRWAGDVRFFTAQVAAGREVTGAIVRDAAGTIIGISKRGVPRPAVRRSGLFELRGQGLHLVRREGDQPCMTAFATDPPPAPRFCTDLNPGTQIDGPYLPYSGAVTVACTPRQAIAFGRFPIGSQRHGSSSRGTAPSGHARSPSRRERLGRLPAGRIRARSTGRQAPRTAPPPTGEPAVRLQRPPWLLTIRQASATLDAPALSPSSGVQQP